MFERVLLGLAGAAMAHSSNPPLAKSIGNSVLGAVVFLVVRDVAGK